MDKNIIEQFRNKTVLVLGDVMLDKYVWGEVTRISPEAPVPIVHVQKESFVPGGAANVASNLSALGARTVLVGMVGNDGHKDVLTNELQQRNVFAKLVLGDRPTTTKVRVMAQRQQLIRTDYEHTRPIDESTAQRVLEVLKKTVFDAIVVSDYAKGFITQGLFDAVVRLASEREVPLFVDVKPKHRVHYHGATVVKTNHKEACELAGVEETNSDGIAKVGSLLVEGLGAHVVITRGEKGVNVFSRDGRMTNLTTRAKQVFDVTGAGDTFLAALALAFISSGSLEDSAILANIAAGIKIGKVGTASVSCGELLAELNNA
jgi:D-beta-D-heptose 7-phosphate kinase/D-beta-D-heptose 1-phosphate adenosyltransferase